MRTKTPDKHFLLKRPASAPNAKRTKDSLKNLEKVAIQQHEIQALPSLETAIFPCAWLSGKIYKYGSVFRTIPNRNTRCDCKIQKGTEVEGFNASLMLIAEAHVVLE